MFYKKMNKINNLTQFERRQNRQIPVITKIIWLLVIYLFYKSKYCLVCKKYHKLYNFKIDKAYCDKYYSKKRYYYDRVKDNSMFKLKATIRSRIRLFLKTKGFKKKDKTLSFLGCSFYELKEHLEKQFKNGMTWENQGKWHIDHIIPLSSAQTENEAYKLCHYTNLQPLWARDNMKKGRKISLL